MDNLLWISVCDSEEFNESSALLNFCLAYFLQVL
jgi:hypothetical protein